MFKFLKKKKFIINNPLIKKVDVIAMSPFNLVDDSEIIGSGYVTKKNATEIQVLLKNGWWESGIDNIIEIKNKIEVAERLGLKSIDLIHHVTHIHAIRYFVSFGMEEYTRNTDDGTKTRLSWK